MAEILAPANTYMFMEWGVYNIDYRHALAPLGGMYYLPGSAAALGLTAATVKPTAITNADLVVDFEKGRHNGGINIAFADGHAKWFRVEAVLDQARKRSATPEQGNAWDPSLPP
jgi:prepilin-type processing-associated H-X9-DG protein